MARYSRNEFAEKCGKDTDWLRVYIGRKKVVETDGWIDDSVESNAYFLKKWSELAKDNPVIPKDARGGSRKKEKPVKVAKPVKREKPVKSVKVEQVEVVEPDKYREPVVAGKKQNKVIEQPDGDDAAALSWDLDLSNKQLANQKAQMALKLQQLDFDKKMGEVVPVGPIKNIVGSYAQNITTSFHEFSEALLIDISKVKALTAEEHARFRGQLTKGINESVERAILETKRQIESIVNEYSNKKRVGEHG